MVCPGKGAARLRGARGAVEDVAEVVYSTLIARRLCSAVLAALISALSMTALVLEATLEAHTCSCVRRLCCCGHAENAPRKPACHGPGSEASQVLRCRHPSVRIAVAIPTVILPRPHPLTYTPPVSPIPEVRTAARRAGFGRVESPPPRQAAA